MARGRDGSSEDVAAVAEREAGVAGAPRPCACGVTDVAPWRGHDLPWSPASFIGGVLLLALAAAFIVLDRKISLYVGAGILIVWFVATAVIGIGLARRGHRGSCWAARMMWMGIAAVGVPVRIIGSFGSLF